MAMYRFFQKEEDGPWFPIVDSDRVIDEAKSQGAKKLTILAVNNALGADDAKRGHKYAGPLYFDIDTEDGIEVAIKSSITLINRLVSEYEVPEEAIQIFCSGKKGLHVLVDQRALMPRATAIKDLPLIYKAMAGMLYVTGLDLSPYACGRNNTFRIANLKRYDGNYRVPLRFSELLKLDEDGYRQMVSKPRPEVVIAPFKGQHSIKLNVLYSEATTKVLVMERELTDRSRAMTNLQLQTIADEAPPCVQTIAEYKGLKDTASFNDIALNLALWASRAGAPDAERNRIFQMVADNAPRSERYSTPRARLTELEGKHQFSINSPDYKFGCGAMRNLLKQGRQICEGCPLENSCKTTTTAEFLSDMAERSGLSRNESGYQRLVGAKGRLEQISTFTLEAEAAYMETMPDGTGDRRRGTLCRVMRHGDVLGTVIMDEASWASKASFLRALEGISGVYYTGGDAEIQKIKMLVFLEEETMPEIHQVNAAGIHIERSRGMDVVTYVEPGHSLNNLHMVDTHRLTRAVPLPAELFKQVPLEQGQVQADQAMANLCRANQAPIMALSIGWFVACHLKAHLREAYGQFPLLALWGQSGSGKSKIAELLASLHGINATTRSKANMSAINRFNAVELLSSTTTVPRLCEEYNRDKMPEHQFVMLGELFKALWNCESAQRGTIVPGQRSPVSVEIPLTAPACIMSEQQIKMPALLERGLITKLTKQGRNKEAYTKAVTGRHHLMRLGQALMRAALKLKVTDVERMLEAEHDQVGTSYDDRPRYSLMVVHTGLTWLMEVCSSLRMVDSVTELRAIKKALQKVTQDEAVEAESASQTGLSGILGRNQVTEIDQMMIGMVDMAIESGNALYDQSQNDGRLIGKVWINPRVDYKVAGDSLYLSKVCHSRYLDWCRGQGARTPLQAWSDVKQLSETEPYFQSWVVIPDFAFSSQVMHLSIAGLRARGINVDALVKVYEVLGTIDIPD